MSSSPSPAEAGFTASPDDDFSPRTTHRAAGSTPPDLDPRAEGPELMAQYLHEAFDRIRRRRRF